MQVVSVLIGNSCKFCVCLFYRHPSNCAEVLDSVYSVLCKVDVSLFSHFVLIGDFIDFMSPRQPSFSMLHPVVTSCCQTHPLQSHWCFIYNWPCLCITSANVISCTTVSPLSTSDYMRILVSYKIPSSANKQPLSEKGKFGVTHSREQMRCSIRLTGNA